MSVRKNGDLEPPLRLVADKENPGETRVSSGGEKIGGGGGVLAKERDGVREEDNGCGMK